MLNVQNIMQMLSQIKTMGGDPNQHIQRLLNSGQVTQAQYNAAVKQAEQLRKMLSK